MGIAAWLIPSVVAFGTEEQKQRFLPPTLRGEMIWCQLFSEPGAGSDLAGLTTKATKVDGGWRITGQKIWTTGAQFSQWGMLLARTDPSAPKHNGITYFLLDMNSDGVEVKPLRELTGNAMFNTVFIDDVFVPDDMVLGEVNRGWEVSRTTLTAERVSIGSSEAPFLPNLNGFVDFIRDGQFDQIGQNHAGHLIAEGHAAKVLNMRSTLLTLAGGDPMPAAAISKLLSMQHRPGATPSSRCRRSAPTARSAIAEQIQGQMGARSCWPAGPPRSTAARRRCSSTSSPSACWDCPAIRKPVAAGRRIESIAFDRTVGGDMNTLRTTQRAPDSSSGRPALGFLVAPRHCCSDAAGSSQARPCYNGIVPGNPYARSCTIPGPVNKIRGSAPDANAIIACKGIPGCLSWYINNP